MIKRKPKQKVFAGPSDRKIKYVIDVIVRGGLVQEAVNIPAGVCVRVIDEDSGTTACYAGREGVEITDPAPSE